TRKALSADGCKVVFESGNDELPGPATQSNVYLVDRCAAGRPVTLVNTTAGGVPSDDGAVAPSISADGARVAFTTYAPNLLPAGTTARIGVVVKDLTTGSVIPASRDDGVGG